ncbi:MAG: ATP-binding cassette domain-containing protein [Bacteroidota bacterium]|jgi:ATP-binding cassette subfamily F protein 3|nr:ATP-binding cassette domain-containing protein [Bacteroidota bacterium]NLP19231.1 ABC-F family ATP-binding cassette domain-containing protein [Bacteroidales bacterium]OQC45476.1 MAG: putative ABC transporter ATP-binding protein YheS [Bacteroidetes bacterium ADurb.Bin028]HOD87945.1 ATP-binding cassette domain-containing protein [Bacteroidales bacterium]
MISVNNLTIRFGNFELFSDIGFLINKRDRIGLVGKNGAGKSTLLKVINGDISPNEGNISVPTDIKIGYLPQQMILENAKLSVFEEARTAFQNVLEIQTEIDKLNVQIANYHDYTEDEYSKLIEKLTHLSEHLNIIGADNVEQNIEKVLKGLGFSQTDFQRKISEFSGGWKMRVELAKILLQNPDVILLDEPTNHLDIEAIQWLESFLETYGGAVLVISHDRAFLDNVTNRTIEINLGKIYDYKVSYSKFKVLQQERLAQQIAAYENQQKLIEDTERFIERFRYKATKANQVQSRIKQLEKLDRLEIDELDNAAMNIKFPPAPRSGDIVVKIDELSQTYDGKKYILNKIDLIVERGEKIAFVGRNGEGKTTLSKVIIGELEYSGELKIGHNVKIGYFAQNQDELLDPELTVFETLDRIAVGDIRTKLRDILGSFLFSGEDIDKKVKVLSGGEHSRLSLAKLLLEPYNLLVLDEPTNHLDMRSKDILKQALLKFDGSLIIVSHDRYFLDGLVDKVYEFKNHKIRQHIGGIYDFLRKKKIENLKELEQKEKVQASQTKEKVSKNKILYLERKEIERQRRSLQNKVEKAEKEIERLEKEIETLHNLLSNPEKIDAEEANAVFEKFSKLNSELEHQMDLWEKAGNELHEFEENNS